MKGVVDKIYRNINPLEWGVERVQAVRFLTYYTVYLGVYAFLGAGLVFLLIYLLCPVIAKQSSSYGITDFTKFSITLERGGSLSIRDGSSDSCGGNTSVCFYQDCKYSLANKDSIEDCVISISVHAAVAFDKFIVNCSSGACTVSINSSNFHASNLIVFGEDVSILADNLSANNILYDSKIGNVEIKLIRNAVSAYLSTDSGDIALQLTQSTSFSSLTSTNNVCTTTAKAWKSDLITAVTDILDIMIENTTTCLPVYPFNDRDHKIMQDNLQHPVFNKLILNQFSTSSSNRCFQILNTFLATTSSIVPSSVISPIIVNIANGEGNVYINILSDPTNIFSLSSPVSNSAFKQSNLKLSTVSSSLLTQTLKTIIDSGKTQEVVFLDFNQHGQYDERLIWVLIFNPIYLHLSPKWISVLSFNSLSSEQIVYKLSMSPGMCPFFFGGISQTTIESRSVTINSIISNFIEKIEIDVYMAVSWQDYKNINTRDRSTFPDVKNIGKGISIVVISEIIIFLFLAIFGTLVPFTLFLFIKEVVKSKETDEKKKVYFYFFELLKRGHISQQSQESQNVGINLQLGQIQLKAEQEYSPSIISENKQQEENKKEFLSKDEKKLLSKIVNVNNNQTITKSNQVYPLDEGKQIREDLLINIQQQNQGQVNTFSQTESRFSLRKKDSDNSPQNENIDEGQDNIEQDPICEESQNLQNQNSDQVIKKLGIMEIQLANHLGASFEHLATNSAAWIQQRFQNSLHFFFSLIFEKIYIQADEIDNQNEAKLADLEKQEKQEESMAQENLRLMKDEVLMDLRSLKEFYQLFCFYFNFQQEIILSDQIQGLISEYGFQIELHQKIFFKKSEIQTEESLTQAFSNEAMDDFPKFAKTAVRECTEIIQKTNSTIDKALFEMIVQKHIEKEKKKKFEEDNKQREGLFRGLKLVNIIQTKIFSGEESEQDEEELLEDEQLLEQPKEELYSVLASNQFMLTRRWKSRFKLNTTLIKGLFEMIGTNIMPEGKDEDLHSGIVAVREARKQHLEKLVTLKLYINRQFFNLLLGITDSYFDLQKIFEQIQAVSLQIIYLLSPVFFCFPLILFVIIFDKENLKFSESNGQFDEKSSAEKLFTFKYPALSVLVYASLVFVGIFFAQLLDKNTFSLTKLVDTPFTILEKKSTKDHLIQLALKRLKQVIQSVTALLLSYLTALLFMINLIYFVCTFIILVLGSILFPKVQLPLVIFIGLLVGIVTFSISSFSQQYEEGKAKLKSLFQELLQGKFEQLQKQSSQNPEDLVNFSSLNLKSQIQQTSVKVNMNEEDIKTNNQQHSQQFQKSIRLQKNKNKVEVDIKEQSASQRLINLLKPNSQKKDVRYYESDEFSEVFQFIDIDSNKCISEDELREFLARMNMEMTQVQMNQMFGHVKVEINPSQQSLNLNHQKQKTFDKQEFNLAMDYLLEKKVSQALHSFDISYEVLYLSVFKMILQSIVIGLLIYSIFEGLSTKDASFDFNTNSIASLGGVIGILFSREEKAKKLSDQKLLEDTVVKVEDLFHSHNS